MQNNFEIAGGSVLGRSHRLVGKNNQDALCCFSAHDCMALLVCDGCGSGSHSEVGAQIGARLVARSLLREARRYNDFSSAQEAQAMLERVRLAVLKRLRILAKELGASLSCVVNDYLLFTVVGALITPQNALFFSLGDGVIVVNDEVIRLGPFPNNAPPYLAYCLVDTNLQPALLRFQVQGVLPTEGLKTFLIGSDGIEDIQCAENSCVPGKNEEVGPLCQFWNDDRIFANSDMVRRRLAGLNRDFAQGEKRENGLLSDDTTLIVGRRKKEV